MNVHDGKSTSLQQYGWPKLFSKCRSHSVLVSKCDRGSGWVGICHHLGSCKPQARHSRASRHRAPPSALTHATIKPKGQNNCSRRRFSTIAPRTIDKVGNRQKRQDPNSRTWYHGPHIKNILFRKYLHISICIYLLIYVCISWAKKTLERAEGIRRESENNIAPPCVPVIRTMVVDRVRRTHAFSNPA